MFEFISPEMRAAAGVALAGMGMALLAGKGIRRLLLLPFEWLARKSASKVDDVIVAEIEKDLGLEKSTLEEANNAIDAEK